MPKADAARRNFARQLLISLLVFAPIGAVTGYFLGRMLKKAGPGGFVVSWTTAEVSSLFIAVLLVISGLAVAFAASSDRRWNRMVERQAPDEPVDPAARRSGVRQALVCILAGGIMMVPPIAAHLALGVETRGAIAGAIALLLAVQTWLNLKLWRDGDELTRAVIVSTGAVCFWTLQMLLFGWATLAKLALVAEVDSWTFMTVLMAGYLIASVVIGQRRGLMPS